MARILIIDDSMFMRAQLRDVLVELGHDVVGDAADGMRAVTLVRSLHPDLVTLDLVMPGRPGLAVLRHLLALDPKLKVVVCSASSKASDVLAAIRLGARGFVTKPFTRERLDQSVREALA